MKIDLKQEIDNLMKIEGHVRGAVFYTHATYIRIKKGEEGVKAVEDKLKDLGYPFSFKDVKTLGWYPVGLEPAVILVAKELFGWTDDDIFDMGNSAPKYSFVVKMIMRYFLSLKRSFAETPTYWDKHYDVGQLINYKLDEEEKYAIVRVQGYKTHPIMCTLFAGYFLRMGQFVIKTEKITIKETKCLYKGDPYHEFFFKWI